jgi:NADH dehydrogenase (ubiquinone) Fe-S protein 6
LLCIADFAGVVAGANQLALQARSYLNMQQAARSAVFLLPEALQPFAGATFFATKSGTAKASDVQILSKDWKAVKIPAQSSNPPVTTHPGQAYLGDLRSTSGLGLGDGIKSHTGKWLQQGLKSPMDFIQAAEPIKVSGSVVASYGSDDPALGCPVEYINLKGTSYDNPAVCKYTGNKYYSDDWMHHH